jgi:hypothetical protein
MRGEGERGNKPALVKFTSFVRKIEVLKKLAGSKITVDDEFCLEVRNARSRLINSTIFRK